MTQAKEEAALYEIEAVLTDVAGNPITPAKVRWLGRELDVLVPGLGSLVHGQRDSLAEVLGAVTVCLSAAMKTASPTLAANIVLTSRRLDALGQKLGLPA